MFIARAKCVPIEGVLLAVDTLDKNKPLTFDA